MFYCGITTDLHRTFNVYCFVTLLPLMAGFDAVHENLEPLSSDVIGLPSLILNTCDILTPPYFPGFTSIAPPRTSLPFLNHVIFAGGFELLDWQFNWTLSPLVLWATSGPPSALLSMLKYNLASTGSKYTWIIIYEFCFKCFVQN